VSAINFRAAAEAALGQWQKAQSDLNYLNKMNDSHQFSAGVTANIPFIQAQILFHEGRPNEGRLKLEAFYKNRWHRFQRIYGNALHQMTDVLRQENKNLTIEDFRQKEQIAVKNLFIYFTLAAVVFFAIILFVLAIFYRRALSEKRRADEANASKMQFLAEVSHEVRTPLNGVLGLIQAMEKDDLSPTQRDRLKIVKGSSKTMLTILNDLLDLAKIDSGKFNLETIEFDIADVFQGVESAFWAQAKAKNISFCIDLEQSALGVYRGDPTRLRQIVDNLVSNAIKFTQAGEVKITIRRLDDALVIEVQDTGIGMDAEAASRVFERFEQAEAATSRRFGGTGLGLSICQNLAKAFGGDIQVQSELGVGTRFIARLPMLKVETPLERRLDLAIRDEQSLTLDPDLKILAAEDHPINRLVLRTLINQFGADVEICENGVQAVDRFKTGGWDIVFLDISMPEMDGVQAVAVMRGIESASGGKRVPIYALTANAMANQVDQYLRAGFDGHLSKPIDAQALLAALTTASSASSVRDVYPLSM